MANWVLSLGVPATSSTPITTMNRRDTNILYMDDRLTDLSTSANAAMTSTQNNNYFTNLGTVASGDTIDTIPIPGGSFIMMTGLEVIRAATANTNGTISLRVITSTAGTTTTNTTLATQSVSSGGIFSSLTSITIASGNIVASTGNGAITGSIPTTMFMLSSPNFPASVSSGAGTASSGGAPLAYTPPANAIAFNTARVQQLVNTAVPDALYRVFAVMLDCTQTTARIN